MARILPPIFGDDDYSFRGFCDFDKLIEFAKDNNPKHFCLYACLGGFSQKGAQHLFLIQTSEDAERIKELSRTEGFLQWVSTCEKTHNLIASDPTGDIVWQTSLTKEEHDNGCDHKNPEMSATYQHGWVNKALMLGVGLFFLGYVYTSRPDHKGPCAALAAYSVYHAFILS